MDDDSAARTEQDERVALDLWQILQRNMAELDGDEEANARMDAEHPAMKKRTREREFAESIIC